VSVHLPLEPNKRAEVETAEQSAREGKPDSFRKPFGPRWGTEYWLKWATIGHMLYSLGIEQGSEILDVGCGDAWTSLFLAESGYSATGIDIAPARVAQAVKRAERWDVERRWGVKVDFRVADMEDFSLGREFDAALVFDALHHTARQAQVIDNVARHVRRGGWVLFGEPSWLHAISPEARRTSRELGWIERGITVRSLKRCCAASGLGNFQRFFEPSRPYRSRTRGYAWALTRLTAANLFVAPQTSIWLAAQRL
jgi:2-polyprenyl-3-methyl-5-hydroxy-6-metoxy-1,4-benzoquinol methylase